MLKIITLPFHHNPPLPGVGDEQRIAESPGDVRLLLVGRVRPRREFLSRPSRRRLWIGSGAPAQRKTHHGHDRRNTEYAGYGKRMRESRDEID